MLQIKRRKDGAKKWRFMTTICLYQDTRHEEPLFWMKEVLGIGFVSRRNDRMSELRINGSKQVNEILEKLLPFLKFKAKQARALHEATKLLSNSKDLTNDDLRLLVKHIITIQQNNYVTRFKKSETELLQILGLTP